MTTLFKEWPLFSGPGFGFRKVLPIKNFDFISADCNGTCRTDFLCAMVNLKTDEMRQCQQQQQQLQQQQQQKGVEKMLESSKSENVERSVEDDKMVNVNEDLRDWQRGKEIRQQVGNDN